MITVSPVASAKLRELLEKEGKPELGLRIQVVGGGCAGLQYRMGFDRPTEKDQMIEADGLKVFIDPKSALFLTDSEIDYVEDLMGSGFKIRNPNAKGSCGCGESFSV